MFIEEVDWLKFMKWIEVGSIMFGVIDEVYELNDMMICWEFLYIVLGCDKVCMICGVDDCYSSWKFIVCRCEVCFVFSFFLKNEKDVLKIERVVVVEEFGWMDGVVI